MPSYFSINYVHPYCKYQHINVQTIHVENFSILPSSINPDCSGFFTLFRRLVDHLFKGLQRTESLIVNRAAVKRQGDPLRRGLQG